MKDAIETVERVTRAAHQAMLDFVAADLELAWGFYRIAIRRHGTERQYAAASAQKALSVVESGLQRLHLTEDETEYFRQSLTRLSDALKKLSATRIAD